jgi:pimeloyl-ACP methyl ester carboxylesterase
VTVSFERAEARKMTARDGTTLALHEMGSGSPLLCIPGGPGRAASYLENLGGLSDSHTLLLLDNRGTGASELPADRDSLRLDRLPEDLEDVRIALDLNPADVLAHSAGCAIALLHAARHPHAVRRLVLVTPSGRTFGWAPDDLESIRATRAGEDWYAEAAEAQLALDEEPRLARELEPITRPFWYTRWDDRAQAHAAAGAREMSMRAYAGFRPGPDYDVDAARESLKSITADVLIVVADRDAVTGVSVADKYSALLPRCATVVVPNSGHYPWVDEPDVFRAHVERFVAH